VKTIVLHPAPRDRSAACRLAKQIAWFFRSVPDIVGAVVVPCAYPETTAGLTAGLREAARGDDDLDPSVVSLLPVWETRWSVVPATAAIERADMVLVWSDAPEDVAAGSRLADALKADRVTLSDGLVVDEKTGHVERTDLAATVDYLVAAWRIRDDRREMVEEARRRFDDLRRRLGSARDVFLLGTGPSIDRVDPRRYQNGVVIACNGIILKRDFMEAARPRVLVIYDEWLLACRRSSSSFREHLIETMDRFDLDLVAPTFHIPFLLDILPERRHDRVVGIPLTDETWWDFDLSRGFWLNATNNVLTALMLPLARVIATGGGRVFLIGCDGRRFDRDAVDWPQAVGVRSERSRPIKPYGHREVLLHYMWLEHAVHALERDGIPVRSLAPSWVPALVERYDDASSLS